MRIACFGGAHLDTKAHLEAEARHGTSNPAHLTRAPGGVACNVARTLARLGVEVDLCSVVGADEAARMLRSTLAAEGIDDTGLTVAAGSRTAGYLAVLEPGGRLVIGLADMGIYDTADQVWAEEAADRGADADLWVVDANLPEPVIERLVDLAPVPVLADPVSVAKAVRLRNALGRLAAVFPDAAEAAALSGGRASDPEGCAAKIAATGIGLVVVSLGAAGVHVHSPDVVETRPAMAPDRVVDVTGAGDAMLAGYAYGLAAGEADPAAWGLAAASLAVETDASVPEGVSVETFRNRMESGS